MAPEMELREDTRAYSNATTSLHTICRYLEKHNPNNQRHLFWALIFQVENTR